MQELTFVKERRIFTKEKDMCISRRLPEYGLSLTILANVLIFSGFTGLLQAADHGDAPLISNDQGADIADVYAFVSPTNPNNTVLTITTHPGADASSNFSSAIAYQFITQFDTVPACCGRGSRSDLNNDGVTNIFDFGIIGLEWLTDCQQFPPDPDCPMEQTISVFFSPPSPTSPQFFFVTGRGIDGSGQVGQNVPLRDTVTFNTIGQARAGLFDDPFFYDFDAAQDVLLGGQGGRRFCDGNESDSFAGQNTLGIVIEVPSSKLGSSNLGFWARTELRGTQLDRMGRPAINTLLIPTVNFSKDRFNLGNPQCDDDRFRQTISDRLTASPFDLNAVQAGNLADLLLPDVLPFDTTISSGFPNGRQLEDDVIDAELDLLTGGATTSDCIDNNDVPFSSAFPYLAPPHTAGQ